MPLHTTGRGSSPPFGRNLLDSLNDKQEGALTLQRLQLFSLVRRRIRGDLICMYKIMHGLLDFPCDAVFAAPTRIGLRGHTLKIHQQQCKTRRLQHAFSVRVVPYWIKLDIQVAAGRTMEVPLPRSSPLTRPQNSLPNLFHPVVSHPMLLV